ncbi:MAG: molybdopterin and thiamine biosynthesis family dinucleotide-utilizing protein [Acidobacteria bacterium OLB17]|nr:MAG: molybdopterin and thiamine biosynthesis family dinucleotide-utilizing protein [Acidobacteria bacterium OLB17]MCZ2390334.1 ThiF family adenylyltransferase [Acidobacteriota bacterium]
MTNYRLRIAGRHYAELRAQLFPGDGLEAVAFILCGRLESKDELIFLSHKVIPVPYADCERAEDRVTWKSNLLPEVLAEAKAEGLALLKIHSHTSNFEEFSPADDASDAELFDSIEAWTESVKPNASAVMLPDGKIFGRSSDMTAISQVAAAGSDLRFWPIDTDAGDVRHFEAHQQLFGAGTTALMRNLRIAVIGCSGTGSVVIEQLARLGVGKLLLVDHDRVEDRNLNRIVNAKASDLGKFKAEVLKAAIDAHGLNVEVETVTQNLFDPGVVHRVAHYDVVFGCMDTAEGRHLLNRLGTFYVMPYFDLGVHLSADGKGGISEASGAVHYLEPGRSSLYSRGAYGMDQVKAEGMKRTNPGEYEELRKVNYIEGVDEHSPAVISVNTTVAGIAVNEFLARLHPYRSCESDDCAAVRVNFMETMLVKEPETRSCETLDRHVGRGDVTPPLDMPSLSWL